MAAVCVCVRGGLCAGGSPLSGHNGVCWSRFGEKVWKIHTSPWRMCAHIRVRLFAADLFSSMHVWKFRGFVRGMWALSFLKVFLWGLNVASGELVVVDYRGFFNGDWRSIESLVHSFEKDWCTYYLKVERFVVVSGCNWILGVWNNFMEISFRTNNKLIESFFF